MTPAVAVRCGAWRGLLPALLVTMMAASVLAPVALAAEGVARPNADAAYRADRDACLGGRTNQDRDTCLREAGAALQEARRGGLDARQDTFDRNRLARCDSQPPEDRELCVRRMNGEGSTSGSVAGGGIYRELVVPEGPAAPAQAGPRD